MSFVNPWVLYALLLIPLLMVIFLIAERNRKQQLQRMITSDKPSLVMGAGFERRLIHMILLCLGVGLLIFAAARPQWGTKLEELRSKGFDIMIAVDVSQSMDATDVAPSRMSKARRQVDNFLELMRGDRVGLIAFAGSAYTYCPLTSDYGAIRLFLESLEPGVITDAGTDIGAAITEARRTYERSESTAYKVLVIFSDGEHHEDDPLDAAEQASDEDITIYTVGIGNINQAGIQIPEGLDHNGHPVYKKDQAGNLVITKLDEQTLTAIATATGGDYYRVSDAGTELVDIYKQLQKTEETEFSSRVHKLKEDRYQLPLIAALIVLMVAYSLGNRKMTRLRRTQGVVS